MLSIVRTDFPFMEDPLQKKVRPALCLNKPIGEYEIVLLAYITTKCFVLGDFDVVIENDHREFENTGLSQSSVIQLYKISAISLQGSDIKGQIGVLPDNLEVKVKSKLRNLLGL
jgi:mRNA-degrading endonuclease toxin of MazEF toxin-antitoxin module